MAMMETHCALCDAETAASALTGNLRKLLCSIVNQPLTLFTQQHMGICSTCRGLLQQWETLQSQICSRYKNMATKNGHSIEDKLQTREMSTQTPPESLKGSKLTCAVCQTAFKLNATLTKHLKSHREKNCQCTFCGAIFDGAISLHGHQSHCLLYLNSLTPPEADTIDEISTNKSSKELLKSSKKLLKSGRKGVKKKKDISCNENFKEKSPRKRRESKRLTENKAALKDSGNVDGGDDLNISLEYDELHKIEPNIEIHEIQIELVDALVESNEENMEQDDLDSDLSNTHIEITDIKHEDGESTDETKVRGKDLTCKICNMGFSTVSSQRRHALVHSDVKAHKCDICGMAFKWSQSLTTHRRIHFGIKPYSCTWCSQKFTQKGTLQQHMRTHTGEKRFRCSFCDSAFTRASRVRIHEMSHTGERPYKCDQCDGAFADPQIYKKHMMNHQGLKPHVCKVCGAAFVMARYLNEHMKKHTGEKKYLCAVCAWAFPNAGRLQRHMLVHSKEKPFKCQFCEKEFRYREALTEHAYLHSGAKPYLCPECGKGFTHRTGLVQHETVHSTQSPFPCTLCHKCFKTRAKLKRHMKTHPEITGQSVDTLIDADGIQLENTQSSLDKGDKDDCTIIEIVPMASNLEEVRTIVAGTMQQAGVRTVSENETTQESFQPIIQAINEALASQQANTSTTTTSTTHPSLSTATSSSPEPGMSHTITVSRGDADPDTLAQYTTVGLVQQSEAGPIYQVVTQGGEDLYSSTADSDLIRQLSRASNPGDADVGMTIMQIQVPNIQQEIDISNT